MKNISIVLLVALIASGCAVDPQELPWPDDSKSSLLVVTGYFLSTNNVHPEEQTCFPGEIIDCGSPQFGAAWFQVDRVLLGKLTRRKLLLRINLYSVDRGDIPFPMRSDKKALLFATSDGKHHDLEAMHLLAKDMDGRSILPLVEPKDLPWIPCIEDDEENKEHTVRFASPKPWVNLDRFSTTELADIVRGNWLEIEGQVGYYKYGLLLNDLSSRYSAIESNVRCEWR